MKKRLTETQFQATIKRLEIGQQTLDIARGVLVEGRPQVAFVKALSLSKGAVSQAVNRVWSVYAISNIPEGYERVSVVLPEHKAYIIKKWGEDAWKKRD